MDKGQYQKAQTVFDRALKTDGKNAKLLYDKAIALFSQRKFEEGRSLCEYGFSLHPGNLRFLKLEADSFKEEGKQGQVLSLYDRILALNPGDTNFRLSVMQYAYENGYPDAAKKQALWFISYNMADGDTDAALRSCELEDKAEMSVLTLSGGEFQRTLIARALAQDTPILLFDEPVNNLDVAYQIATMHLLQKLVREQGKMVLLVLHANAEEFADCHDVPHSERKRPQPRKRSLFQWMNMRQSAGWTRMDWIKRDAQRECKFHALPYKQSMIVRGEKSPMRLLMEKAFPSTEGIIVFAMGSQNCLVHPKSSSRKEPACKRKPCSAKSKRLSYNFRTWTFILAMMFSSISS